MKLHNGQRGARVWGRDGGGGAAVRQLNMARESGLVRVSHSRLHPPALTSRLTSPYEATSATRAQ